MRKVFFVIIIFGNIFYGCSNNKETLVDSVPDDLGFTINYFKMDAK